MGVTILSRGDAFAKKVAQAMDLFYRTRPGEWADFVKYAKQYRAGMSNAYGETESGGLRVIGHVPSFVRSVLAMTEDQTKRLFRSDCGTGDTYWDCNGARREIFHRVAAITATSSDSSFCARGLDN